MKLLIKLLIAGGAVSAPAFTVTMTALSNASGTVTTLAFIAGTSSPLPVSGYGATADAGEVNTSDTVLGTRYFFDADMGSDANPGTSAGSPAQTLAKLFDYTTSGGSLAAPQNSAFMLARGDTFNGFVLFNQFTGSFYGNFFLGASGAGARPKVLFAHSPTQFSSTYNGLYGNRAGPKGAKNIAIDMQNVFRCTNTAGAGVMASGDVVTGVTSGATGLVQYLNGTDLTVKITNFPTRFTSGETIQTSGAVKTSTISNFNYPNGVWFESADWTLENCSIENATGNGILIGISGNTTSGNNATITNCTVSKSCNTQITGGGIDGGLGSNITITNNTVFDCGQAGSILSHNIYLNDINNSTIARNWAYMTANNGNHALVMHGNCDTVLIEDNLFEKCQNGIGINDGYSSAAIEVYNNFTIRRNINRLHGTLSGQTQGQAMELACMTNSAIYNNLHYSTLSSYSLTTTRGSGGVNDSSSANVTFSHETLYNVGGGMKFFNALTGIVVQNCIFMSTAASGNLLNVSALSAAGVTLRNCIFWMPNNAGNAIVWNGTAYTIAAFLAGPGAGMGHINANPLFVDASTGDFRLQAGSPAKLAGYNSGITTDFAGNARHATTPSIGAYE